MSMDGKVVLVTGTGEGIGRAIALRMAKDGTDIALVDVEDAYCPGVVGTDMWVELDERFAEITGPEVGATYKKYVEGIAQVGRATRA